MVYLVIMVLVAAVGIGSLLLQQHRQAAHLDSVEGFRESLKKISPESAPGPFHKAQVAARRPQARRTPGRPTPLDAKRREAARRRLEARRRRQLAQAAGSRSGF